MYYNRVIVISILLLRPQKRSCWNQLTTGAISISTNNVLNNLIRSKIFSYRHILSATWVIKSILMNS